MQSCIGTFNHPRTYSFIALLTQLKLSTVTISANSHYFYIFFRLSLYIRTGIGGQCSSQYQKHILVEVQLIKVCNNMNKICEFQTYTYSRQRVYNYKLHYVYIINTILTERDCSQGQHFELIVDSNKYTPMVAF